MWCCSGIGCFKDVKRGVRFCKDCQEQHDADVIKRIKEAEANGLDVNKSYVCFNCEERITINQDGRWVHENGLPGCDLRATPSNISLIDIKEK